MLVKVNDKYRFSDLRGKQGIIVKQYGLYFLVKIVDTIHPLLEREFDRIEELPEEITEFYRRAKRKIDRYKYDSRSFLVYSGKDRSVWKLDGSKWKVTEEKRKVKKDDSPN